MTVLIVPDAMAPDLRRYVANNGRIYTTHAGQAAAAPYHPESQWRELKAETPRELIVSI